MSSDKLNLELSSNEARILLKTMRSIIPDQGDEMLMLMLYNRLEKLVREKNG